MSRLVFFLEEYSMKVLLEEMIPRVFPGIGYLCVPHEGKQDLEKSVPRKLRAWREPGVRFVVVRDNDGSDCRALKARLVDLCREAGRPDTLVRLACQELEAWYLGDLEALAAAFNDKEKQIVALGRKAPFRDADAVAQPSKVLEALVPAFQKVKGARLLGQELVESRNTSKSFRVFVDGVRRLARELET